jgi:hypothetical protein
MFVSKKVYIGFTHGNEGNESGNEIVSTFETAPFTGKSEDGMKRVANFLRKNGGLF